MLLFVPAAAGDVFAAGGKETLALCTRLCFRHGLSADLTQGGPHAVPDPSYELVGDHSGHFGVICITHQTVTQLAFPLGGFRSKNMALKSLVAFDLAFGSFLETLGCAFVCF